MQDQVRRKYAKPSLMKIKILVFWEENFKVANRKGYSSQIFETLKCSKKKMFD